MARRRVDAKDVSICTLLVESFSYLSKNKNKLLEVINIGKDKKFLWKFWAALKRVKNNMPEHPALHTETEIVKTILVCAQANLVAE